MPLEGVEMVRGTIQNNPKPLLPHVSACCSCCCCCCCCDLGLL